MEASSDPRVTRTNQRLRTAMVTLLDEQPLHSLTVQALTQTAGVTRATFYRHYQDKQDFIDQTVQQVLDEWFAAALINISVPGQDRPVQVFSILDGFQYVVSHQALVARLMQPDFEAFVQALVQRLRTGLAQFATVWPTRVGLPDMPAAIEIAFNVAVLIGLLQQWLASGTMYRPDYLASAFQQLVWHDGPRQYADWFVVGRQLVPRPEINN